MSYFLTKYNQSTTIINPERMVLAIAFFYT